MKDLLALQTERACASRIQVRGKQNHERLAPSEVTKTIREVDAGYLSAEDCLELRYLQARSPDTIRYVP